MKSLKELCILRLCKDKRARKEITQNLQNTLPPILFDEFATFFEHKYRQVDVTVCDELFPRLYFHVSVDLTVRELRDAVAKKRGLDHGPRFSYYGKLLQEDATLEDACGFGSGDHGTLYEVLVGMRTCT